MMLKIEKMNYLKVPSVINPLIWQITSDTKMTTPKTYSFYIDNTQFVVGPNGIFKRIDWTRFVDNGCSGITRIETPVGTTLIVPTDQIIIIWQKCQRRPGWMVKRVTYLGEKITYHSLVAETTAHVRMIGNQVWVCRN